MTAVTVLEGFAGAGGLSEGARMIGLAPTLGFEVNADACRTADAAGHRRVRADVRALDPASFAGVEGWISGPPCPTYAASGKRTGRTDYATVLAAVERLADCMDPRLTLDTVADEVADPRTVLVLETLAVALTAPHLRWMVAEQVPAVAGIWQEFAAEMAAMHRWDTCTVLTLRADDFGAATRRTRVFLIATRQYAPDLSGLPYRARWDGDRFGPGPIQHPPNPVSPFPATSMAAALGWPSGVRVNTRGNRRTPGGNEFSADRPALSLTGNGARTWYRTDLGPTVGRLTDRQAGLLQTFPPGYPWQGSRSSRFQRIADAVPPVMAAAVLGAATGRPWHDAVWNRLAEIYGTARPDIARNRVCTDRPATPQLDLFTLPTPHEGTAA
ncbi:DNA cytosine methyltransferase [Actinomadura soli]|uniref:DNA cytosine methyltransferase n=1 Tax=Actinomadura soli TaxID=2508997 RepID=A0A5C4J2F4_9ACTN|nr:DNA cytosine methyltransferase [Actinomadura soli]TMQ90336.1 DNA cytosine methyltransferase [Actinomadura soli]